MVVLTQASMHNHNHSGLDLCSFNLLFWPVYNPSWVSDHWQGAAVDSSDLALSIEPALTLWRHFAGVALMAVFPWFLFACGIPKYLYLTCCDSLWYHALTSLVPMWSNFWNPSFSPISVQCILELWLFHSAHTASFPPHRKGWSCTDNMSSL